MALKGNLHDFPIPQLLNLIHLAHKTGSLIIEGPAEKTTACFADGRLIYAQIGAEENDLIGVLKRAHRLSGFQTGQLIERSQKIPDFELGLFLVNAGLLTQQEILDCLRKDYTGAIFRLLDYDDGVFRFENDERPPQGRIPVKIELESLLQEGARLRQEMEQLHEEIPNLDMALKFSDRPGKSIRNSNLMAEEWRVVTFITPQNTIRKIAQTTRNSDFEIRRIVSALRRAGLVEIVSPEAGPRFAAEKHAGPSMPIGVSNPHSRPLLDRLRMRNSAA